MPESFCPLCDSCNFSFIKREGVWDIVECRACSFVFVKSAPDEQALYLRYQEYLPSDRVSIARWRAMMAEVFQRSLDVIDSKASSKSGALLDIGCGYGFFLEMARQRGWRVFGIEPCAHARAYAKSRSVDIEGGDLFDRRFADKTFDVITLFYVLEHLPEPLLYLKEICRILKEDGLLLVRVPHTTPIVKILKFLGIRNKLYDAPSHLSDFSPRTIAAALKSSGFNDIHTFPGGSTRPYPRAERIISVGSGMLADFLYVISGRRLLIPGVSKTTIARKSLGERKHSAG